MKITAIKHKKQVLEIGKVYEVTTETGNHLIEKCFATAFEPDAVVAKKVTRKAKK